MFKKLPTLGYNDKVVYSDTCSAVIDAAKMVLDSGAIFFARREGQRDVIDLYYLPNGSEKPPVRVATVDTPGYETVAVELTVGENVLATCRIHNRDVDVAINADEGTKRKLAGLWGYNHGSELRAATVSAFESAKAELRKRELAELFGKAVRG